MILQLAKRLLTEPDSRLLANFAWNFGARNLWAIHQFKKRLRRGRFFPAFMFLSITNRCNLRCRGCWVTTDGREQRLSAATMDRIVRECKKNSSRFFGILGGEPLLHPELFDVLKRHRDCYFQVFTNGTALTDEVASRMRRLGNVTPLVSVEGDQVVSDSRRGGKGVFRSAMTGLDNCRRHRLITGVASSICRSNIDDLLSERFLRELIARRVHYMWYYIYRPVGPDPSPDLALSQEQLLRVRKFIVEARQKLPIIIVDAYWDDRGNALCPAAVGISHHVGPAGDVEPCPPIQFACENASNGTPLSELMDRSEFLGNFRKLAAETTRGCILMERPDLLREFIVRERARDTTGRGSGLEELAAMRPAPSHGMPGREIPERSWAYRFAKKHWFFGFGAYG